MNKALKKLNENLEIAIKDKNENAIRIIKQHIGQIIDKVNRKEIIKNIALNKLPCIYRGKLLYEKDCKCKNGRIWECEILGQVVERLCNAEKCKGYTTKNKD